VKCFRSSAQKTSILKLIAEEAENNVGQVQTYTMIEWVRENYEIISDLSKATSSVSASQDSGDRYKVTLNSEINSGIYNNLFQ